MDYIAFPSIPSHYVHHKRPCFRLVKKKAVHIPFTYASLRLPSSFCHESCHGEGISRVFFLSIKQSPFSPRFILKGVTASWLAPYFILIHLIKSEIYRKATWVAMHTVSNIYIYTYNTIFSINSVTCRPHWKKPSQGSVLNHKYLYIELGWFKGTPDFHFFLFFDL